MWPVGSEFPERASTPVAPVVEVLSSNPWTTREFPEAQFSFTRYRQIFLVDNSSSLSGHFFFFLRFIILFLVLAKLVLVDVLRLPLAAVSSGGFPCCEHGSRRTGFTSAWLEGSVPRLRSCGARA